MKMSYIKYLKHIYLYEENQSYVDDAYPYIERLECNYQLNKQSQFVKESVLLFKGDL